MFTLVFFYEMIRLLSHENVQESHHFFMNNDNHNHFGHMFDIDYEFVPFELIPWL